MFYTYYTYDSYGNVLTTTDALGRVTDFSYSSAYGSAYLTKQSILVGTQNVTTTYAYNFTNGLLTSETDPNGETISYKYDALGRLTLITYPAVGGVAATKSYAYSDANNILTVTDEDGHVTQQFFDGLARLTKVEIWNGSSLYSTQTYTYNWLNEVATNTTAAGDTYTYSYDSVGRLTEVMNPDTTYTTTSYNDVTNQKTVTDENGHQTVYSYDWNNRLTSVEQYNASSTYYLTSCSYDTSGNLLSVTDAKGQVTSYQYDNLNRLTTTTFPDTTTEIRTYDSVGNLLTRTTANNSQIFYTYDALNRLTEVAYPGSGGTVTYTYDADSNTLSMVSPSASDYYTYDARDRVTNATEYVAGVKYQTLYAYDNVGNIITETYPDSYSLSMTYDVANRLKTVGTFATIAYTLNNEISKITYGDSEAQTYTYNSMDRPTQILDMAGKTKYLDLNYTYGPTGDVLSIGSETYSYDWLDRLTQATGFGSTITYTYDQVGNLVKTVAGTNTTTFTYGPYNRLVSWGGISYTYDKNGNLITKTGGWTYSYDYEDRLTKVIHSGSTVQQNFYDGAGNLVKNIETDTKVFSYQGLNMIYEKDTTSGTITKLFYADDIQVAQMIGNTIYYMHPDALGSTRLVMTTSLTIQFSSDYKPFGLTYSSTGSETFKYVGKMSDSVTGLYYFGARWYDPSVGRFVTEDSYPGSQSDPMSLNRYVYARDNPESVADLTGHWGFSLSSLVSALSNTASKVVSSISSGASAIASAVSSIPSKFDSYAHSIANSKATLTQESLTVSDHSHYRGNFVSRPTIRASQYLQQNAASQNMILNGQVGAVLATLLVGDLTIAAVVAIPVAIVATIPTGGASLYTVPLLTFGAIGGMDATGDMVIWDWNHWSSATPEGAFAAGGNSFVAKVAEEFINKVTDIF